MNFRKVIGVMLVSFGLMASVSASYTDELKQKYADGSFYIEYKVTRQNKKGDISKNQEPAVWNNFHQLDKYIYAQKGDNKYYQRNDFSVKRDKVIASKKTIDKILNNYREDLIVNVQMEPLSYGHIYEFSFAEIENEGINVVKDGKIYALDRFNACGYWSTAEKINDKPRLAQVMCANMIVPTIFNSILFSTDNTGIIILVSSEDKHAMGLDAICETYTYQKTNEYGSPIGEIWYFQLFYKDGELVCFSDAISKQYYNRSNDKQFVLLNKVNVMKPLEDENIFDVIDDYSIKEFEVE